MEGYTVPLTLIAIFAAAYFVGRYVSRSLRMPDSGWKVSLIVTVIGLAMVILWTSWPPRQGIDLKGGVILVYEVDDELTSQNARTRSKSQGDEVGDTSFSRDDMPGLIQALTKRINPGGVQEIVVRAYGDKQVEIIIPDVAGEEIDRIKKLITTGGFLKFQIVANQRDHGHIWSLADQPSQQGQYEVKDSSGKVVAQWAKLALTEDSTPDNPVYRFEPFGAKTRTVRGRKEVLMKVDPNFNMQGSHLAKVRKIMADMGPAVAFDTTVTGARLMGGLTDSNLPDELAGHYSLLGIVMDGELLSAPQIQSRITSSGEITGRFTNEEVDRLINVLRAGRLPAVLRPEPISQNEISPLLGEDTIRQGKFAIGVSLAGVLVFMIFYYRFAGVISCLALLLNLALVLALMIFVGAAFSLPGMAALVLTVGMSVDANVLIFERIREELKHGAALRMAIRNGFGRATSTIVDANVTTLITAVVLYRVGTEQLKAFAVALIFGILMTLFSAIFCSRVVFDLFERSGKLRRLTMMQVLADSKLNLFQKRGAAAVLSVVLIVVGLVAVGARNRKIFDIDFLGGTSVQLLLKEPLDIANVRERAEVLRTEGIAQDVSVTEVKSQEHGSGRIYRIDTSLPEAEEGSGSGLTAIERVQKAIVEQFQENGETLLTTRSFSYTEPASLSTGPADTPDLPTVDESAAPESGTEADTSSDAADDSGSIGAPEASTDDEADATPDATDGSAVDLPSDSLLALADDALLAQAELAQGDDMTMASDIANGGSSNLLLDASALRSEATLTFGEPINADTVQELIEEKAVSLGLTLPDVVLTNDAWDGRSSASFREWTLQMSSNASEAAQILSSVKADLEGSPVWVAASQIGSSVAGDKTKLAVGAVLGSLIGIIAYIWIRFKHLTYGLAAVVALVHDVLVTLGAIAMSYWLKDIFGFLLVDEFKISLPVVAAFLTIIGYSLNDTIVVFDRIREVKGKSPKLTAQIINDSINQTLSRTVLTSLTTLIAVLILYVIGGQGIHAFAFALLVGVVVGTYSSIFVASPALLWMSQFGEQAEKKQTRATAQV